MSDEWRCRILLLFHTFHSVWIRLRNRRETPINYFARHYSRSNFNFFCFCYLNFFCQGNMRSDYQIIYENCRCHDTRPNRMKWRERKKCSKLFCDPSGHRSRHNSIKGEHNYSIWCFCSIAQTSNIKCHPRIDHDNVLHPRKPVSIVRITIKNSSPLRIEVESGKKNNTRITINWLAVSMHLSQTSESKKTASTRRNHILPIVFWEK